MSLLHRLSQFSFQFSNPFLIMRYLLQCKALHFTIKQLLTLCQGICKFRLRQIRPSTQIDCMLEGSDTSNLSYALQHPPMCIKPGCNHYDAQVMFMKQHIHLWQSLIESNIILFHTLGTSPSLTRCSTKLPLGAGLICTS